MRVGRKGGREEGEGGREGESESGGGGREGDSVSTLQSSHTAFPYCTFIHSY